MSVELTSTVRRILEGANVAVLATLLADGAPQTTAVWVHVEGDTPIVATTRDTLKFRNVKRDPRVALTAFLREDPYVELNLRGHVARIADDKDHMTLNMLSEKYYGIRPYPYLTDEQEWVRLEIEVDRARTNKELPDD